MEAAIDSDSKTLGCEWPVPAGAVQPRAPDSGDATASGAPRSHPLCQMCEVVDQLPPNGPRPGTDGLPVAVRVPLRAGARLFEAGTVGQAVYVVQSGIVKETLRSPDGRECIVRLVSRGGITGLGALLAEPHRHSAHVLHPGYACRIPLERIERMRAEQPHAMDRLFADWQRAVDDADRIISELAQGPARARLARALVHLRSTLPSGEPLRLRRDDLAQMMALTPASIARLMGDFRREGLVEMAGRSCVAIDRGRLQQISREGG